MQQNSFYSISELAEIGFKSLGENVLISRFARFYDPEKMSFGNHVRIDDFCILSGEIIIHNFVHISAYVALYGKAGIEIHDYAGISPGCKLFSASDDFSGNYLIGPMVPKENINLNTGKITLEKYVQIGANSVVLPNVTLKEGSVTGAISLINKDLNEWSIYTGVPAVFKKKRSNKLLKLI